MNATSKIDDSSGQGHPYWYEWFVGLIEVVKLLNPDEKVESVAFQVSSIKVWDDVVVQADGQQRCYQIKHTRVDNSLTFGDLVTKGEKGKSLLGDLFEGRQKSALRDSATALILYTNRNAGTKWSTRQNGDRRPPLLEFWSWLKTGVETVDAISKLSVPRDYRDAWLEWVGCLDTADDTDAISFFRQLEIRTEEDELDGLENRIRECLAVAFGISQEKAAPLFDALCRALKTWTTGHSGVNVETLHTALTLPAEPTDLAPAPPPPTPFFPTRIPVAEDIERELLLDEGPPIVFLTGEPGSGKTSAVSWLANRRAANAFEGIIGLRFFCFEPIRPEKPFIAPDSSRVRPEDLWFSLLTQLRQGLAGRLHELAVPLRNSFLDWKQARDHVLRLADELGEQLGRRFVISIDGIDHAARAAQSRPEQIADFFASLPSPEELERKKIRLLIAGQPPEYYAQSYPSWLRGEHSKVSRIDLPRLRQDDIRSLLEETGTNIPGPLIDDTVRVIEAAANGNTLAIVFAVAEAESTDSLEELETRLEQRSLVSGLTEYYNSIWKHALRDAPELSCPLAGAISLARRPLTAEMLAQAFAGWGKPISQWQEVLFELGPLLTQGGEGFQIRHNDVRVFLASEFRTQSEHRQQAVASQLATHCRSTQCDRLTAHLQLFDLLVLADRHAELAEVFDVDWVIEGSVLGIEFFRLGTEGELAASHLSEAGNWTNVVSVACALQTLDRIEEDAEFIPELEEHVPELPPFLPAEASVRPLSEWKQEHFRQMIWDAHRLVECNERDRAIGLLDRWLGGLTFHEIVESLPDIKSTRQSVNRDAPPGLDQFASTEFENFGGLCGRLDWAIQLDPELKRSQLEDDALFAFEEGLVNSVTATPRTESLEQVFVVHQPIFLAHLELAVRNLARNGSWSLVADLLAKFEGESFTQPFLAESTWFALRSAADGDHPSWLSPLDEQNYGLSTASPYTEDYRADDCEPYFKVCRALGWTRIGFDTGEIAASVLAVFAPHEKSAQRANLLLLFEAFAVAGRIDRFAVIGEWREAASFVSPDGIRRLLFELWSRSWYSGLYQRAAAIAEEIADYCMHLGEDYDDAVFKAALPLAEQCLIGPRMNAMWHAVSRRGRLDVLRKWTEHHLEPNGAAWEESHDSARYAVSQLAPFAESIGQTELARYARKRASWLRVDYRGHKEYGFEEVSHWLLKAVENDPQTWEDYGWRLWQLCGLCEAQHGDNRIAYRILDAISAAAMRCGPSAWWRLMSTTLERTGERDWHYRMRASVVQGMRIALEQNGDIRDSDILPLWSIALSLSYWSDNDDNESLRRLREMLLDTASESQRHQLQERLQEIRPVLTGHNRDEAEDEREDPWALSPVEGSQMRSDSEFWEQLDNSIQRCADEDRRWGFSNALFETARKRAFLHGNDVILGGLGKQLEMHARWAFGAGELNQAAWQELPELNPGATWETVAVELLNVLLSSYSEETIGAALEGMHALVNQNPDLIGMLFERIGNEWPRRWLINAAECWAVLYPDAVAAIRDQLQHDVENGNLDMRLQTWVVLSRNCDSLGEERIAFPVPETPALTLGDVSNENMPLLNIPPCSQGARLFANHFSAAQSMLEYCKFFGFTFGRLEGIIAKGLGEFRDASDLPLKQRGPHRSEDSFCNPLDTEKAFGHAISQVLAVDWCTQEHVAQLCAAILPNEDPWIYRERRRAVGSFDEWPSVDEYGPEGSDTQARKERMCIAATQASVSDEWVVFAALVRDVTSKEDFVLSYWYEHENEDDSLLISVPRRATCPGGRSFVWWIGDPVEQPIRRLVSGLFVGGRLRLSHCNFEIRPPRIWRDEFGWEPNASNPLEWLYHGEVIARYERLHGVLRSPHDAPHWRQPVIDRWIITRAAFKQVESFVGTLRERHTFEASSFKGD